VSKERGAEDEAPALEEIIWPVDQRQIGLLVCVNLNFWAKKKIGERVCWRIVPLTSAERVNCQTRVKGRKTRERK